MPRENELLDIRLRLDGEVKQRFLEIKRAKGLTNNTEVLRLVINEYHKQIMQREVSSE